MSTSGEPPVAELGEDRFLARNTVAATTTRISLGADGAQSNNVRHNPSIAADGKTIAL